LTTGTAKRSRDGIVAQPTLQSARIVFTKMGEVVFGKPAASQR
jgi:hypothetical protein